MRLRMKKFNIMGFHWKILFFRGEGGGGAHEKSIYRGELVKKGDLGRNRGVVFMGVVDTLMHTMLYIEI